MKRTRVGEDSFSGCVYLCVAMGGSINTVCFIVYIGYESVRHIISDAGYRHVSPNGYIKRKKPESFGKKPMPLRSSEASDWNRAPLPAPLPAHRVPAHRRPNGKRPTRC